MDRYRLNPVSDNEEDGVDLQKDPKGEWRKNSDVEALEAENKLLKDTMYKAAPPVIKELKEQLTDSQREVKDARFLLAQCSNLTDISNVHENIEEYFIKNQEAGN